MIYKATLVRGKSFSTFSKTPTFGQLVKKGVTFQGWDKAQVMEISSPVNISKILRRSKEIQSFEVLAETDGEEEFYIS